LDENLKVQQFHLEDEKRKQEQKRLLDEEKLKDIKLAEEYTKILNDQEQKRIQEYKEREEIIQKRLNRAKASYAKKVNNQNKNEEEGLCFKNFYKLNDAEIEAKKRKERIKQLEINTRKYLDEQIINRKKKMKEENLKNIEYAEKTKEFVAKDLAIENKEKEKIKKKFIDNMEIVKKQMEAKKYQDKKDMNEYEYNLNREYIQKFDEFIKQIQGNN